MPYLTPDGDADICTISITVPASQKYVAAVVGALNELSRLENWEDYGDETSEEAAQTMLEAVGNIAIGCQTDSWILGRSRLGFDTRL